MNTYRLRLVGEYSMGYDIVYHILCLVSDGYDKLSNHLSYPMFNQTWDKISDGIYYLLSIFHQFHMRYVNPMGRYEIYISHVSKIYLFL